MQLEEVQSVGKWISRWSKCEKGSQNTDQSKNVEEKSLRRASLLIGTSSIFKNVIYYVPFS